MGLLRRCVAYYIEEMVQNILPPAQAEEAAGGFKHAAIPEDGVWSLSPAGAAPLPQEVLMRSQVCAQGVPSALTVLTPLRQPARLLLAEMCARTVCSYLKRQWRQRLGAAHAQGRRGQDFMIHARRVTVESLQPLFCARAYRINVAPRMCGQPFWFDTSAAAPPVGEAPKLVSLKVMVSQKFGRCATGILDPGRPQLFTLRARCFTDTEWDERFDIR